MLQLKRIYEEPTHEDGYRILVDRLWPRGIRKEQAALDMWLKEIAPSNELRIWFNHQPERFATFTEKYRNELAHNVASVKVLQELIGKHPKVTLLYGAKDPAINHAVVLQKFLEEKN